MQMKLFTFVLAALTCLPALAQDDTATKEKAKGKGKGKAAAAQTATAQLLKQLEVVGLTEDQVAKIKELGKKTEDTIKKVQTDAEITPALLKKRREAMASMKDSDKKGKAKTAAVDEAAGLTKAQGEALAKANEMRTKFKAEVIKMLSVEQKAKLPEALKAPQGGKKANADADGEKKPKKKDAA